MKFRLRVTLVIKEIKKQLATFSFILVLYLTSQGQLMILSSLRAMKMN